MTEKTLIMHPKRHSSIETTTLPDGHVVLVSKKTEWAQTLTPVGALVWEFCDGTNTIDDIIKHLRAIPEIGEMPSLDEEVAELIEELDESGFFEES